MSPVRQPILAVAGYHRRCKRVQFARPGAPCGPRNMSGSSSDPFPDLFKEGYFALENCELVPGHVPMVSRKRPRSGFNLRHLPAEQAELISLSRIVHSEILLPAEPGVQGQSTGRCSEQALRAVRGDRPAMTASKIQAQPAAFLNSRGGYLPFASNGGSAAIVLPTHCPHGRSGGSSKAS
jgi:hypothetical protein